MTSSGKHLGRMVVLPTDTVITPFNEHPRLAIFTDQTIEAWQHDTATKNRLELVKADSPEHAAELLAGCKPNQFGVLILDRHFITPKILKDFIRVSKKSDSECLRVSLARNASVEYTEPLQTLDKNGDRIAHDIYFFKNSRSVSPANGDWLSELRKLATWIDVPKKEIVRNIPLPTIGEQKATSMRYPVTTSIVVSIEHWVHILWLNQLSFGIRWVDLVLRQRPFWALFKAFSAMSFNIENIMNRLVSRGSRCKIHPTAHISGSIIGSGVTIGPNVTIRNSYICANAVIQDHAVILNSVIGEGALILENTFLVSSTCYPQSTVGNYKLQVSLIGRGAYVNAWAGFVDAKFVGSVNVSHKGELTSTDRSFLGSVVGHGAKVAAKVLIHPGREIPNETVIVMRPDEIVSVVPDNIKPNQPLVRHEGTLVPLGMEKS